MAGCVAPMAFVVHPAFALCDICPGADKRQAFRDGVDVTVLPVNPVDLPRHPVVRDRAAFVQIAKDDVQKGGMFRMADPPEVRHPAHIPEQPHRRCVRTSRHHFGRVAKRFQRHDIIRFARPHQFFARRCSFQRRDERVDAAKAQIRIAPLQFLQRREPVIHDRLRHPVLERAHVPCHTKGAILLPPARTARDLRQLVGREGAHPAPVKLGKR